MNSDQRISTLEREIDYANRKIAYYPFLQQSFNDMLICTKIEDYINGMWIERKDSNGKCNR
jgi:hypothetical protein